MLQGYGTNFRSPKVDIHDFSMIPRADIPRSAFRMQHQHKTTISAGSLVPVYLQEVLPGDSFNVSMAAFCRLSTPLFPIMDNMQLESFFFFVPNRLVWSHWYKFMGEQDVPGDSTSFSIPQVVSPVNGFQRLSVYDYFGLPCAGQTAVGNTISVSALPLRCYGLIFNQWFRDENQTAPVGFGSTNGQGAAAMDDGPDPSTNYNVVATAKRHDYFTAALPFTQKSATPVSIPLTGSALVKTNPLASFTGAQNPILFNQTNGTSIGANSLVGVTNTTGPGAMVLEATAPGASGNALYPNNLFADLTTASSTTINQLRLAFQTQKLLERDARGGTRYTEIIRSHFGVISPDMRLQRPEYLGGGRSPVNVAPVPQTGATGLTGGSTPLGSLSAVGTVAGRHGFRQAFTEHGHIVGVVCVRADPIYQQGIRRLWKRATRFDFYFPVFAMLGEQSIFNYEIFSDGGVNDPLTFGFQERWAEYRYHPSFTTGFFNSTNPTPLDAWHLAQKFASLPALNATFMIDQTASVLARALAAGAAANNQQLLCDFFFDEHAARPMPMYSVPGLIDHF